MSTTPLAEQERANLLQICRAVMPGVAGVILSTRQGRVVAREETRQMDADALARRAAEQRRAALDANPSAGQSTLVPGEGGLYLVVFVPEPLVAQWGLAPLAASA